MQIKKLVLTAGAVGVIGIAGSAGTFAAFTDTDNTPQTVPVSSGTIQVENNFALPDLTNLGTRDTTWNCDGSTGQPAAGKTSECWGGTGPDSSKRAGSITVKNVGSLKQDFYIDFDGVGKIGTQSPNVESGDVIADNLIIDAAFDENFSAPLYHAGTRLWVINRSGPQPYGTLEPGQEKTVFFRAHLRERKAGEYAGGDNELQGKSLTKPQTVKVSAVETGRDDLLAPFVTAATDQSPGGADAANGTRRYDYGN